MRRIVSTLLIAICFSGILGINGCSKINIFSLEDDKNLGAQVEAEIASDPSQFPVLSRTQYPAPYAYLEAMKQKILASGKLEHANDFEWKLYIINDDATQNAFCTPGGYIYIYTGLIHYLDNASSLAGVLGHEMSHADQRHSTIQMTEAYGISTLLSVAFGNDPNQLATIAAGLTTLAFSRSHEKDADTHSVTFLCPTTYRADGAADFFQKIINSGAQQPPQFLSTHPNPDNRVANIQGEKTKQACSNTPNTQTEITEYNAFKASLP